MPYLRFFPVSWCAVGRWFFEPAGALVRACQVRRARDVARSYQRRRRTRAGGTGREVLDVPGGHGRRPGPTRRSWARQAMMSQVPPAGGRGRGPCGARLPGTVRGSGWPMTPAGLRPRWPWSPRPPVTGPPQPVLGPVATARNHHDGELPVIEGTPLCLKADHAPGDRDPNRCGCVAVHRRRPGRRGPAVANVLAPVGPRARLPPVRANPGWTAQGRRAGSPPWSVKETGRTEPGIRVMAITARR